MTNRDAGTLAIVDVATLKEVKNLKTGSVASSLAFSTSSKALYVTNERDGTVAVIDASSHKLLTTIEMKPGIRQLRFAPGGRWGFVPNPDSPRVVHCFEVVAKANPAIKPGAATALRIEYLNKDRSFTAGENYKIRFKLTDAGTNRPNSVLKDVGVLVFQPPGNEAQRWIAQPLGDGLYEVTVNVPEAGVYLLFVESPSQRVVYRQLPYLTLHANAAPKAPGGTEK